jgi:hypothetical protein
VRAVEVELPFDFVANVGRQRKVGLADVALDHAAAGRLERSNARPNFEGVLRAQQLDTTREQSRPSFDEQ